MASEIVPSICFAILVCLLTVQGKHFIRLATEFENLDQNISSFIKNPTNEGWEDNLLDMGFYVRSLQSIVRELDGGITLGTFVEAEKVMLKGKPNFIDMYIDDEKFIMDLKIADEQLQRFYYMQKFAQKEWEEFSHMVTHKKQMSNLLL